MPRGDGRVAVGQPQGAGGLTRAASDRPVGPVLTGTVAPSARTT